MDKSKFCRFCLHEAKSNSNSLLTDISTSPLENLREELTNIGISIKCDENIPPLSCKNCLIFLEKLVRFLETARNSQRVLSRIYKNKDLEALNKIQVYKDIAISTTNKNNFDQYGDSCDSEQSELDEDVQTYIKKQRLCRPTSARTCIEPSRKRYFPAKKCVKSDNESNLGCAETHSRTDTRISVAKYSTGQKSKFYDDLEIKNENITLTYTCGICSEGFDSFFDYQDHQHSHNGQYVFCCSKCSEIFSNRDDVVQHEKSHKVPCTICKSEVLPKSLPAHLTKHTDLYKCMDCNSRHSSRAALQSHIRARHAGIKGYVCYICGKQNSCQASMRRHLATHLSYKPFKCEMCTFATKSKSVLKVHVLRRHSNNQSSCHICHRTFKSKLSLLQHMKRIHEPKKHVCKYCGKPFSEQFNMNQHIRKRHDKQQVHECKECHMEFFTVLKLKEHMRSHRSRPVSCRKCGKDFVYKKYLKNHEEKCSATSSEAPSDNVPNPLSNSHTDNCNK